MTDKAVYLISCCTEQAGILFKIGVSKSPYNRFDSIKESYIKTRKDAETAQLLAIGYPDFPEKIERDLMDQYHAWNFQDNTIVKGREWFQLTNEQSNSIVRFLQSFPSISQSTHEKVMQRIEEKKGQSATFIPLHSGNLTAEQLDQLFPPVRRMQFINDLRQLINEDQS